MMSRNPFARSLAEPQYRQRVINGSARRSWPAIEEFETDERAELHASERDAAYRAERLERLAAYCKARSARENAAALNFFARAGR